MPLEVLVSPFNSSIIHAPDVRNEVKRLVKGAISPADKRIADYCDVFTSLEKAFYNSLNVSEHLMASQTLDELESLGTP